MPHAIMMRTFIVFNEAKAKPCGAQFLWMSLLSLKLNPVKSNEKMIVAAMHERMKFD